MSKVLVSYHTFSGKTKALAEAAAEGAKNAGAEVLLKDVTATTVEDVSRSDALIIATPQPFRTIAGETKKLFERLWKDREQVSPDKPYGVIVCHATECAGTLEALEKLGGYYKLAKVDGWVTVGASELEAGKEQCRQLGARVARDNPGSAA